MSTKITVHVTKGVLEKTKNCKDAQRSSHCAISYAVRELFPNARTARTDIYFDPALNAEAPLPMKAQDFIYLFDNATPWERSQMNELSFEIEVPDEALEGIDISEVHRIISESKTLSLA